MKVYPSSHQILQTKSIHLDSDIPLAYIDTERNDYEVEITPILEPGKIKQVMPYDAFDSYDVKFFKPKGQSDILSSDFEEIDNMDLLQRDGDVYRYIPRSSITFNPQRFSYNIVAKKKISYKNTERYDMKIGCSEDTLAKLLIKAFGDSPDRGVCPNNIWANHKDLSHTSLISQDLEKMDFMFIASKDGKTHKNFDAEIDLNSYFEYGTNIWIVADNLKQSPINSVTSIKYPLLYNEVTLDKGLYDSGAFPEFDNVSKHTIFSGSSSPVAIYEKQDEGFIIVSHIDFINNIDKNIKAFYEILFYVYSKAYCRTGYITDWIADTMPDYVVVDNKITTKDIFLSKKKISEFFDLSPSEISFSKVLIDKENVVLKTFVNDYIQFEKKYTDKYAPYADPIKPDGMISIYTPRQNIVYFNEFVYTIEDDIREAVSYTRYEDYYEVAIGSFKNSFAGINLKNTPINKVKINLTKVINYQETAIDNAYFYLCVGNGIVDVVEISEYNVLHGTILCKIYIGKNNNEVTIYDMRRRGGGLVENEPDNYSLLDIGHIQGLAYRKAGAIVITLPKHLEPYKDRIEKVVAAHMVAEKFPIIIFEKEDDQHESKERQLLEGWSFS